MNAKGPSFSRTVGLLLRAAWRRSVGRQARQRQILRQRPGGSGRGPPGGLLVVLMLVMNVGLHIVAAYVLIGSLGAVASVRAEQSGQQLVSWQCLAALERICGRAEVCGPCRASARTLARTVESTCTSRDLAGRPTGEADLVRRLGVSGLDGLRPRTSPFGWAAREDRTDPWAAWIGMVVLLVWMAGLAFQGEGLDLDLQRRRHPMWEWLLGHPVETRAVFLAEMLGPLASNLTFWTAPVFWIVLFGVSYDSRWVGLVAGLTAGLPLAVAASCTAKAIEIWVLLRWRPSARGAALGLAAWLGQAAMFVLVIPLLEPGALSWGVRGVARLGPTVVPPILDAALGRLGTPSPWKGVLACWIVAGVVTMVAVQGAALATRRGLAGAFAEKTVAHRLLAGQGLLQRADPAVRKELLWFWRDRGALVQVFLVPLTLATTQLFNLRALVREVGSSTQVLTGASVIFGSYFLLVLGPRSLLSEGPALWLPLTWPRGLEELLRAKAKLWWQASLLVTLPLLLVVALREPTAAWSMAVVALGWILFARGVALKGVTLVSAPSSAGTPEPVPLRRRAAAALGTVSFGIGVATGSWRVALLGLVYSWVTAAAVWQEFRNRLPYLLDPWSEPVLEEPSLVHGLVALMAAVDLTAVLAAILSWLLGVSHPLASPPFVYTVCAGGAAVGSMYWLWRRGVSPSRLWCREEDRSRRRLLGVGAAAAFGGVAFGGLVALAVPAVMEVLHHIPWLQPMLPGVAAVPQTKGWPLIATVVVVAPLSEEYLFRGLIFRGLEREWGSARALAASTALFVAYHPPIAWVPVGLMGLASAIVFRRSGHLLPSVLLHAAYNAAVVGWS